MIKFVKVTAHSMEMIASTLLSEDHNVRYGQETVFINKNQVLIFGKKKNVIKSDMGGEVSLIIRRVLSANQQLVLSNNLVVNLNYLQLMQILLRSTHILHFKFT